LQTENKRKTTGNTGLAKVAVQCSADTFVVNQSLVLRINICSENCHLRQARNRWQQAEKKEKRVKKGADHPVGYVKAKTDKNIAT